MQVTIGGNRVGSGQKMKAHLNNYFRSTHNLSEKWASSMGSGILYPCMVKPAMRGDVFEIGINADARTIPTKGPLFGSFKMQIDVYQCPVRLYQALLHNNPLAIGLKMNQVKFPLIKTTTQVAAAGENLTVGKFSKSCLMKYLGVSGMGTFPAYDNDAKNIHRVFNAIPMLAYYEIFKTYYANKQEEVGYVITSNVTTKTPTYTNIAYNDENFSIDDQPITIVSTARQIGIQGKKLNITNTRITLNDAGHEEVFDGTIKEAIEQEIFSTDSYAIGNTYLVLYLNFNAIYNLEASEFEIYAENYLEENGIELKQFNLSYIDDMRYYLLSQHTLGTAVTIDGTGGQPNQYPYKAIYGIDNQYKTNNRYALNGLVLKTYQNDIYNNWLNKNWIEGEGSIADLSKVAVVDGTFTMDALNFAQKLYNMLNRVAVSDGTYESWQDVMYEEIARKQIESPIFLGGMSQEVMFDEIVQTAPADGDPLGTLGGRGRLVQGTKKGGKIRVKVDEASFIIAIVSLTPRIFYTQGNEFYMTDLFTMDDFHKPGMDGIGFQDLIGERMAWFDTKINNSSAITYRSKIGKVPAWIEYMTSVDRAYGDLAEEYGKGYMILNRNYEMTEDTALIKDATTYIDPQKYNYAFAYTALDAQNFWVEIAFDIKARRKMSARLIPNV